MLTSYTSSEEENILFLRKFAQNMRNSSGSPKPFFEDTADQVRVDRLASCENIVPRFQTSSIQPNYPPDWYLTAVGETLLQPVLKSFITVFIQYNEGQENKLTRALLLGSAKSIY